MTVSESLARFIARCEGFRARAYRPLPTDRWTIGYGSTFLKGKPVVSTDVITEDDAFLALKEDLAVLELGLRKKGLPLGISGHQLDAVLSLVYNIGLGAFNRSDTGSRFYAGHDISDRFELYNKSGGKIIQGLVNRRLQEKEIYVNGEYVT